MNKSAFCGDRLASEPCAKKKIALVIGNGPSVDQLDPALFPFVTTYGCNHIGQKFPRWNRPTDHVVITDSNRITEIGPLYKDYTGGLFVGDERYILPPVDKIRESLQRDFTPLRQLPKEFFQRWPALHRCKVPHRLRATVFSKDRCAFDLEKGLNFGFSVVSSAIQLAAIHGHTTILLTGVDSHYRKPKDYFEGAQSKVDYVNHDFVAAPRFFMEPILVLLQLYLERMGVSLVDCTPGGALRYVAKGRLTCGDAVYELQENRLS